MPTTLLHFAFTYPFQVITSNALANKRVRDKVRLFEASRNLVAKLQLRRPGEFDLNSASSASLAHVSASGSTGDLKLSRAKYLWQRVKSHAHEVGQNKILLDEWYKNSKKTSTRLRLAFLQSHSVLAPTMHSGNVGFTRAQTVMFLFNTFALELVLLTMQFSAPDDQPVTINPVSILGKSALAVLITLPSTWLFAAVFEPVKLVNGVRTALKWIFCLARPKRDRKPEFKKYDANKKAREFAAVQPFASPSDIKVKISPPPSPPSQPSGHISDKSTLKSDGGSSSDPIHVQSLGSGSSDNIRMRHECRVFSSESLDVLIALSLRRQLLKDPIDKQQLAFICAGWLGNWSLFVALQLIFISYGCTLAGEDAGETQGEQAASPFNVAFSLQNSTNSTGGAERAAPYILSAWGLSLAQRLLLAEPVIILASVMVPLLLGSRYGGACCGETINNVIATVMDVVAPRILKG